MNVKSNVEIAQINIPVVVMIREPNLSEIAPANGAIIAIESGMGVKIEPVTAAL